MDRRLTFTVLGVLLVTSGIGACARPQTDCEQLWKNADGNDDGVLDGPEAGRDFDYYRIRATSAPINGRITRAQFVSACQYDLLHSDILHTNF